MNDRAVVILTYPGHYLLTALTIQSYLKYHPTPSKFIIVADDVSQLAWPDYIRDCEILYSTQVIPVSSIKEATQFSGIGWVRQQIVKLYLDQVLDLDSWFFTDGDIVFLNTVDDEVPYSVPYFSETTQLQNDYVKSMLGVDHPGVTVNSTQVCVSNPAFRAMNKEILIGLRNHIHQLHNKTLSDLHQDYTNDSRSISEWELIENFRQHVLKEDLNLVKYAPQNLYEPPNDLTFFTHQFFTCYNTDKDFGRNYFSNQGITVSDEVWQILSNINR